jgi:hypothetical protein
MLPVLNGGFTRTVQEWVQAHTEDDKFCDRHLELKGLDVLVEASCVEAFDRVLAEWIAQARSAEKRLVTVKFNPLWGRVYPVGEGFFLYCANDEVYT